MLRMPDEFAPLFSLCRRAGARVPWWTQGPGGNASRKQDGVLWIKASGARLREVAAPHTVAALRIEGLSAPLRAMAAANLSPTQGEASYRALLQAQRAVVGPHGQTLWAQGEPSMESGMHAVLPGRDVLHVHALSAIALATEAQWPHALALGRAHRLRIARIEPTVPGWQLCARLCAEPVHDAYVLENHGLVLQGDDGHALLDSWQALEEQWLQRQPLAVRRIAQPHALDLAWLHTPIAPRMCLPDLAVFWPRVMAITEPAGPTGHRRLRADAIARDGDAAELFAALLALDALAPNLPALHRAYTEHVQHLPEEQRRLTRSAARLDQ